MSNEPESRADEDGAVLDPAFAKAWERWKEHGVGNGFAHWTALNDAIVAYAEAALFASSPQPAPDSASPAEGVEHCRKCGKAVTVFFWCDMDPDERPQCEECFPAADCERDHGEGCATKVFAPATGGKP